MPLPPVTRRTFVESSLAAALLGLARPQSRARAQADDPGGKYQLYWGDLHNHNAVGYAKGSLERSIEIAQEHLDFFAFTGHASWHDLPKMPGDRHMKWINGFEVHKAHWPQTRGMIREANSEGFAALLGYEWHSSQFGDYCLIFPEDQPELFCPTTSRSYCSFRPRSRRWRFRITWLMREAGGVPTSIISMRRSRPWSRFFPSTGVVNRSRLRWAILSGTRWGVGLRKTP